MIFFFKRTAPTEIYTLSLHDALPISCACTGAGRDCAASSSSLRLMMRRAPTRSEEHTSELQSLTNLVCRLLLEKKNRRHLVEPRASRQIELVLPSLQL